MSSREKWLRVYDCGRNDSGEQLVGVVQGPGPHVAIVVARQDDLRDAPPAPPEAAAAPPACQHRYSGYRYETGDEILREIFRCVDAGEDLQAVLRVGREHLADGARLVQSCVDCGAIDVYRMTRCGHPPWDREHGAYPDCHEAA